MEKLGLLKKDVFKVHTVRYYYYLSYNILAMYSMVVVSKNGRKKKKRPSALVGNTSLVPINLDMQFYTLDEHIFNFDLTKEGSNINCTMKTNQKNTFYRG